MSVNPTDLFRRNARKLLAAPLTRRPTRLNLLPLEDRVTPAVTGLVFNDLNANGVFEPTGRQLPNSGPGGGNYTITAAEGGAAGVRVTAFRADGSVAGVATTDANGAYSLGVDAAGAYRVEFTNLPVGTAYGPAAPSGSGTRAGTAVQFVPNGNTSNINLSVVRDGIVGDNPLLMTSRFVYGGSEDRDFNVNRDDVVLVAFPYSAGSNVNPPPTQEGAYNTPPAAGGPVRITHAQVGTTWGLAQANGQGFAAAYTKRHSGYGPGGAGTIYAFDLPGTTPTGVTRTAAPWFTLPTATVGATELTNARAGYNSDDDWNRDSGNTGWDAVGKTSFGGLDTNDAGTELYVMNLGDQRLYVIPINPDGTASSRNVQSFPVPTPVGVDGQPIARSDVRPFAVEFHNGQVYVGIVNSAESTQNRADVRAYVYTFDPSSRQYSTGSVVDDGSGVDGISLAYERGVSFAGDDDFLPWSPTFDNVNGQYNPKDRNQASVKYPQAMLTGLAFDAAGNLTLGFRSRDGDQTGIESFSDPNNPTDPIEGIGGGDILKAFANGAGRWALEQNAASPVGANPGQGTGGGNGQGPGGGEFYGLDGFGVDGPVDQTGKSDSIHTHVPVGGVLALPGVPEVLTTTFDPPPNGPNARSGGVRWYNFTTGELDKAYQVYTAADTGMGTTFGKSAGVGDLIVLPQVAVEIGNRVWKDDNRNGVQDAGEPVLAGVPVQLVDPAGQVLAETTTSSAGEYFFSSRPGTDTANRVFGLTALSVDRTYTIRVPLGTGPTTNLLVTGRDTDGSPLGDFRDNDFAAANGFATATVTPTLLKPVDHNTDLGLFDRPLVALGDTVWNDVNNDGLRQANEPLLSGVTVTLFREGGARVGATTTNNSGLYFFRDLDPGTYYVEVGTTGAFSRFVSSTGANGARTGPFEPGTTANIDDQDHGTQITPAVVRSGLVTLFDPGSPNNPSSTTGNRRDANFTVDFGLFEPLSAGDFVWNDANNNGTFDSGEAGLGGVKVDLLNGSGQVVGTTSTNTAGGYLFTYLVPGTYQMRVDPASLPNANFRSSTGADALTGPFEPVSVRVGNNQDHGSTVGAFVFGPRFNLNIDSAPTRETATPGGIVNPASDANSDTTQDFGFFEFIPLSVGNFVWEDANNNGSFDAGETPLGNFLVELMDANGRVLSSQRTNDAGGYLFTGLFPGTYQVRVITGSEYRSSTGTNGDLTRGPFEPGVNDFSNNTDHGTQGQGLVTGGRFTLGRPRDTAANPDDGGTANLRQDFGLFRPLSVGNFVWNDANNNGSFDTGEAPLAGVPVLLFDGSARQIGSTTTDANGIYGFGGLVPGVYSVRIVPPAGLRSSTGTGVLFGQTTGPNEPGVNNFSDSTDHGSQFDGFISTGAFTLGRYADGAANPDANGTANLRQDFGLFQPVPPPPPLLSIGNFVFQDDNNNGVFDGTDTGIGGITVELLNGSGQVLSSQLTAGDGSYLFTGLQPGAYQVQLRLTPGETRVSSTGTGVLPFRGQPTGTGPFEPVRTASTVNNEDHGTQVAADLIQAPAITLGQTGNPDDNGTANLRQDFGLTPTVLPPAPIAQVSGFVYRDTTTIDGVREPARGETGIPGTTVTLTGVGAFTGNRVTLTTITDLNGFYQFTQLEPGDYVITETQPPLFIDGIDTIGSLGGTLPANDVETVTLRDGDAGVEYNFGEILPASLFGFVYLDANKNCAFDPGETPLSGVSVTISGTAFVGSTIQRALLASDSPVGLTVTTDASGRYEFPVLPVGTYTVVETQPLTDGRGRRLVDGCDSTQEPTPRPVTVGNDVFTDVVAGPNEQRGPLNFGENRVTGVTPDDDEPSKDDFLGSTPIADPDAGEDPTVTPPVVVGPDNLPTNPPFLVGTGKPADPRLVAVGTGVGRSPLVRVFDYATGTEKFRFNAYEQDFTGGVRVTTGDVDGDGVPDIITSTGIGGGPRVRVFSGKDGSLVREFFAYENTFRGGVFVAAGDINGDGRADIVVGSEIGGGPRVTVFDGATNEVIQNFFAFDPNQRGGVRVATADFTGDGKDDLVVATGAGVPTRVRVFEGDTARQLSEFAPYEANFTGGVFVAAGDTDGDGRPNIITSADVGGGPNVLVFDGLSGGVQRSFFAYETDYTGGARVTALDVTGDGKAELITTPGIDHTPQLKIIDADSLTELETFGAFDARSDGGVYVG